MLIEPWLEYYFGSGLYLTIGRYLVALGAAAWAFTLLLGIAAIFALVRALRRRPRSAHERARLTVRAIRVRRFELMAAVLGYGVLGLAVLSILGGLLADMAATRQLYGMFAALFVGLVLPVRLIAKMCALVLEGMAAGSADQR